MTLGQYHPFMQDHDMATALGFIQIRGAQQYRQALLIDELEDYLPQFATRQRIDADRRFIEQKEFWRSDKGAARPSFCFIPPESRPAKRLTNEPSAVISINADKARAARHDRSRSDLHRDRDFPGR